MQGKKFGRFTVVEREPASEQYPAKRGAYWKVRCDCGSERIALGAALRSGRYTSCGCAKGNAPDPLIGVRHGKLVVVAEHAKECGKRLTIQVRCDCGTSKVVTRNDFKAGRIKSCGCSKIDHAKKMAEKSAAVRASRAKKEKPPNNKTSKNKREHIPRIDLSGRRFGMLTVKGFSRYEKGGFLWLCSCDCGGEKEVNSRSLRSNNTCSCGCARKNRIVVRPEHTRKNQTSYQICRRKTDSKFAINKRMRDMVRKSLVTVGSKKRSSWKNLVGYTTDELEIHLKKRIPDGYKWEDFLSGALHIDHVIPLSAFNFERETDADFQRAWALKNLQLLPAKENLLKSDTLSEPFQPSLAM